MRDSIARLIIHAASAGGLTLEQWDPIGAATVRQALDACDNSSPRSRYIVIAHELGQRREITSRRVVELTGLSYRSACRLLENIACVLPVYYDGSRRAWVMA